MPHDLLASETEEKIPTVKSTKVIDKWHCFLSLCPVIPWKIQLSQMQIWSENGDLLHEKRFSVCCKGAAVEAFNPAQQCGVFGPHPLEGTTITTAQSAILQAGLGGCRQSQGQVDGSRECEREAFVCKAFNTLLLKHLF